MQARPIQNDRSAPRSSYVLRRIRIPGGRRAGGAAAAAAAPAGSLLPVRAARVLFLSAALLLLCTAYVGISYFHLLSFRAPLRTAWEAVRGLARGGGKPQGRPCIIGTYDGGLAALRAALADTAGPGFDFARYADGELVVAQGRAIGNSEWFFSPEDSGVGSLQSDLLASLRGHHGKRYWYAFASPLEGADKATIRQQALRRV